MLYRDAEPYNILWNAEVSQAMVINFKWAKVLKPWAVLGIISLNQKRKWVPKEGLNKQPEERRDEFM